MYSKWAKTDPWIQRRMFGKKRNHNTATVEHSAVEIADWQCYLMQTIQTYASTAHSSCFAGKQIYASAMIRDLQKLMSMMITLHHQHMSCPFHFMFCFHWYVTAVNICLSNTTAQCLACKVPERLPSRKTHLLKPRRSSAVG